MMNLSFSSLWRRKYVDQETARSVGLSFRAPLPSVCLCECLSVREAVTWYGESLFPFVMTNKARRSRHERTAGVLGCLSFRLFICPAFIASVCPSVYSLVFPSSRSSVYPPVRLSVPPSGTMSISLLLPGMKACTLVKASGLRKRNGITSALFLARTKSVE